MTYSAAMFDTDAAGRPAGSPACAAAQRRKIDRLLDITGVGPGSHVLELGTGWGELAIRAAARGARVRTVTLSAEQRELADGADRRGRAGRPGDRAADRLPRGRGPVRRDPVGRDDRGGRRALLARLLHRAGPAARAGRPDRPAVDRHAAPADAGHPPHADLDTEVRLSRRPDPVGAPPSSSNLAAAHQAARGGPARLRRALRRDPADLAGTVLRRRPQLAQLGFDEIFRRMWLLYLCYAEAGIPVRLPRCLPVPAGPDRTGGRSGTATGLRWPNGMRHDTRVRPRAGAAGLLHPSLRSSSGASCRSGSGPGMAARLARPARPSWCCAPPRRCAGCCGTRASSASPRPM